MNKIKAIGFDLGHTLVDSKNPLNLQSLYDDALKDILINCGIPENVVMIDQAKNILLKYNTRINHREHEVKSDDIFTEIFNRWGIEADNSVLNIAKRAFYDFIQNGCIPFDDTLPLLQKLKEKNIKTGILTDVAYGMDNCFSMRDIIPIERYMDITLTSVDVGFRKPNSAGYLLLLKALQVKPEEMLFVGDEDKDIEGANAVNIPSVLINRDNKDKNYGQLFTVKSLTEVLSILCYQNC